VASSMSSAPVLLTHGAGSDRDHPSLIAIEAALVGVVGRGPGRAIHRMNFPYRDAGKKLPGRGAEPLLDSICMRADEQFGEGTPVVLGGRSMGGRMCSMVAAEARLNVVGLVLICYPLHPPKKPENLRTDHFASIYVPCLFISGSQDPFGTPEELAEAITLIPGEVTSHTLVGADHSLAKHDGTIAETVSQWLADRP
jgi:uncharacterized protein